jgi:ATP-dependent Lon protease
MEDIPEDVKNELEFVFIEDVHEAVSEVLLPAGEGKA